MDRGVSWFMLNNNGGNIKSDALAHSHRQMPSSSGIWFHKLCWSVMSHWDLCVSFFLKTQKIENTFVFVIFYPSLMAANTFLCVSVGYYIFFSCLFRSIAGGVCVIWPSGGEWRRCGYRGYRLQVTDAFIFTQCAALCLTVSDLVPLTQFVQTPGAWLSPANQLTETETSSSSATRHHRERGWWRAKP